MTDITSFLIDKNLIDGKWLSAQSGATITVINPATHETLGVIPDAGEAETVQAIEAAHRAFPAWAAKTAYERADILMRWHDLVVKHLEALSLLMTVENGKPLAEARVEVAPSNILWAAEEAKRIYGRIVPSNVENRQLHVIKQPIGVAGMITPWNFPAGMITRKVGPALAAGCTVVLKPDHRTPYSTLALGTLAMEAGMPPGVLNIITGDAPMIGKILTTHPLVGKISFTGSTPVGRLLAAQAAPSLKKMSLELGGNAPFIVFDDVDVTIAATRLSQAKMRNTGQSCVSPNRIYVHEKIHDAFVEKLLPLVKAWKVGDGREDGVQIGPLIDAKGMEKVATLVDDAIQKGATCLLGGKPHALGKSFYEPTLLTGVTQDMQISRTEIFGPVIAIQKFSDETDVLKRANDTEYGLAAYVFTNDLARTHRMTTGLQYGQVGVNWGVISFAGAPFGGIKQSGMAREGGVEGIDAYSEVKYIAIQT